MAKLSRLRFIEAIPSLLLLPACAVTGTDRSITFCSLCQVASTGRVLYQENADEVRPAASLLKLLVAIAVVERTPEDAINNNAKAVLDLSAFVSSSPALGKFAPGAHISVRRLLYHMIVESDNLAANALITYLGQTYINELGKSLGLDVTRVTGLFYDAPPPSLKVAVTTARECNIMLGHIVSKARSSESVRAAYRHLLTLMRIQNDRRFIPAEVRTGTNVADKTGEISGEINDSAVIGRVDDNALLFTVLVRGRFSVGDPVTYQAALSNIRVYIADIYKKALAAA